MVEKPGAEPAQDRLWATVLGVGVVVGCAAVVVGDSGARTALELGMLSLPILSIQVGLRRYRPAHAIIWRLLAFAFGCFAVGWVFLLRWPLHTGPLGLIILPHVVAIPACGLCLTLLLRAKHAPRKAESLLDPVIVVAAATFVAWRAAIGPAFAHSDVAVRILVVVSTYPALDAAALVVLLHLTFATSRRSVSWALVLLGLGTCLLSDVVLAVQTAHREPVDVAVLIAAFGYLLIGAAALHPSMVRVTERGEPPDQRLPPSRVGLLGMSLLSTPLLILLDRIQHTRTGDTTLLVSSGLVSAVVLGRMVDLARQAERARRNERAREQRFESLVRHSTDVIAVLDPEGMLTYVSPSVERVLGHRRDDLARQNFRDWVHEDDLGALVHLNEQLLAGHGTGQVVVRARHADGSWRWIETHAVGLVDDPDVGGIVINGRDVTERVLSDQVILANNSQQAAVAELGRDALTGAGARELADRAVHLVRSTLQVSACDLVFVETDDEVQLAAREGIGTAEVGSLGPLEEQPLIARCLTLAEPVEVDEADPESGAAATVLAVRITDGSRPIGALVARAGERRAFRSDERSFVQSMASTFGLAMARREVEFDARHQALHDTLTGLPNRALFVDRLEAALARIVRHDSLVAVLFLDVDHFKVVNDSLGHNAGDRILVSVAQRLQALLRPGDTVARFGGDEFTVLCEDLESIEQALEVGQRIQSELSTSLSVGRAELHTTVSIGIAVSASGGTHPEAMLRDADAAMYRAKERGRNRVELFDDTMRYRAVNRLRTEIALREAISADQLVLHFQPVVELQTGQFLAAEALVRWQHPRDGLIAPAQFIPIAEEAGIIHELGRWVLEQALLKVAEWHRELGPVAPVLGVNVSARTLAMPGFPAEVAAALASIDAPPNLICLEITESAIMDDVDRSLDTLGRLRDLGLTLAIDDFGTGYSSLSYLRRFPVDVLKIDRSFIDGLGRDPEDSAIVAAVVNLAHTLDRLSIAEGVETALQLRELQRLGCQLGQGFLFSPAVPAADLDPLAVAEVCVDPPAVADPLVSRSGGSLGPRAVADPR